MVTQTTAGTPLTDLERRLVDHVTRGEPLDLAGAEPVDEAAMRSWDNSRTVQASVLRDILRGRLAPDPIHTGCSCAASTSPAGSTCIT